MLDTLAAARRLTDAGIKPEHADAIVDAVRQAADAPAEMATKADIADLRTELGALEARIAWRIIGALLAVASIQTAILIAVLRTLG